MPRTADGSAPAGWALVERHRIAVVPPYRLDLTVAVLRRSAANLVDIWTDDGRYLRAVITPHGPLVYEATQAGKDGTLHLRVYRPAQAGHAEAASPALDLRSTLGTQVDLTGFYSAARKLPVLQPLVERARGVKPPHYPSLWESICNTVLFQQVSLEAAITIMGRLVTRFGEPLPFGSVTLHAFPEPAAVFGAGLTVIRSLGLTEARARALHQAAEGIATGRITDAEIAGLSTEEAVVRLTQERGIGRWTASLIMLRGFGRLDVFPMGDAGVRRGLRVLAGEQVGEVPDAGEILETLGPWRGMLYYHLLLLRLEQHGRLPCRRVRFRGSAGIHDGACVSGRPAHQKAQDDPPLAYARQPHD